MEKTKSKYRQVIITGPESTGKTELANALAGHYQCDWIPELARSFIQNLSRKYAYGDVEQIARLQIQKMEQLFNENKPAVIDTGLIITKVWFDVVYKKCPAFVIDFLQRQPKINHLLCATDLPWEPDPVRENGGEMRELLFDTYQKQLEDFNFPYHIIYGVGNERLKNATRIINTLNIF